MVVIGLDGLSINTLLNLTKQNAMPYTKTLLKEGTIKQVASTLPPNSAVSWTSIYTGVPPGEHGVFGFTSPIPGTYSFKFHNYKAATYQCFWERNPRNRVLLVNLPVTYPVRPLNGVHVSGFVSPTLEKAVHPDHLKPTLEKEGYIIDVSPPPNMEEERFFQRMEEALRGRVRLIQSVGRRWDLVFIVFTGPDRLGHFFGNEMIGNHISPRVCKYFKALDGAIETIMKGFPEGTPLALVSDHGMVESKCCIHVNHLLETGGYLRLGEGSQSLAGIQEGSKAFFAESNNIYINKKNRFPKGAVEEKSSLEAALEVKEFLLEQKHCGKPIFKEVYLKEEIYSGPHLENAPDLVCLPTPGFSLSSSIGSQVTSSPDSLKGCHSEDDAFVYLGFMDADLGEVNGNWELLKGLGGALGGVRDGW